MNVGEPDADHESELIDGQHQAVYIDLGTLEQRMLRLESAMGEPPSEVLTSLMPERHKEGRISVHVACRPCGFYIDGAPTFEAARLKARELIEYNNKLHARKVK